jgi:y4mF family transcriptional regulator
MKLTPQQLGAVIQAARKNLGVTQKALALTSGTGLRFIVDLERGKPTCQIGKALIVLSTLGVAVKLTPPPAIPEAGANLSTPSNPGNTAPAPSGKLSKRLAGRRGPARKPDKA